MVRMRSQTSVANSGIKEATTYSYIVFCTEILRVANWASTWANQMWGSAGQKGGSLMLAAEGCGFKSRPGHQLSRVKEDDPHRNSVQTLSRN